MHKTKNITQFAHCYGCGVCSIVCPKKIIKMRENNEGFYQPYIQDAGKCINCGLCLNVCAYNHQDVLQDVDRQIEGYAGWTNDENIRLLSSSGGISFEIGRHLLQKGYKACMVRYDCHRKRACHYVASNVDELALSIGSKYIPSMTTEGLEGIDLKGKTIVVGTPCQIDSLRRFVRQRKVEDRFVLVDFFCHGTPSLLLWDKYLEEVEPQTGEVQFVSWRNKLAGWHDSWNMMIHGASQKLGSEDVRPIDWHQSYALQIREKKSLYFSQLSKGDLFYRFFLSNCCLNTCCYQCKYKSCHSAADLRIGDLWGKRYAADTKGTSGILALTEVGQELIRDMQDVCTFISEDTATVMEGQMKTSPRRPWVRKWVIAALKGKAKLSRINRLLVLYRLTLLPQRVVRKLQRIISR